MSNFYCEQTTQQTSTSATWTTVLACDGTNMTGSKQYAVWVQGQWSMGGGGQDGGVRFARGATPTVFTGASFDDLESTGTDDDVMFTYFTVFTTAATPDDLLVQIQSVNGSSTVKLDTIGILGICLDCDGELTTSDWKFNENTSSQELTPGTKTGASITFTSAAEKWAVWANCAFDGQNSTENNNACCSRS